MRVKERNSVAENSEVMHKEGIWRKINEQPAYTRKGGGGNWENLRRFPQMVGESPKGRAGAAVK